MPALDENFFENGTILDYGGGLQFSMEGRHYRAWAPAQRVCSIRARFGQVLHCAHGEALRRRGCLKAFQWGRALRPGIEEWLPTESDNSYPSMESDRHIHWVLKFRKIKKN